MRAAPVLALALAFALALPLAQGNDDTNESVGLNLGVVAPGVWDMYWYHTDGGAVDLRLTWTQSAVFPFADYDLRLYQPWAYADDNFDDNELVAQSSQHPYAHHAERIARGPIPSGTYWLVVAPFQAQNEEYTVSAAAGGWIEYRGTHLGYVSPE